jgi:Bacterial protein of unknown function (DUF903)
LDWRWLFDSAGANMLVSCIMKKITLLSFAAMLLFTACAHRYVITLNNKNQITAYSKPQLDRGYYIFKDAQGNDVQISAGRVTDIVRASLATKTKAPFKPETK